MRCADVPPERSHQFNVIEIAALKTLLWAGESSVPLMQIEPVVPFAVADFSLNAWLFFDMEANVELFRSNGTSDTVIARFRTELARAGYPAEWLGLVECHVASREVVEREYQGSYYLFLR